ncbi:MAG TPA: hypothetical protein VGX76_21405, partial [Pirellulales bacterium]|nr:hypothetical protein [Pirellulales bacterium]
MTPVNPSDPQSSNPFASSNAPSEAEPGNPFAATDGPDGQPPRLSIQHLMGWTAATAVYLGISRTIWADSLATQKADPFSMFLWVAWSPVDGAFVAGLLLFVIRRLRRQHWPLHPGDWLLVVFGAQVCLDLAANGVLYALLHDRE